MVLTRQEDKVIVDDNKVIDENDVRGHCRTIADKCLLTLSRLKRMGHCEIAYSAAVVLYTSGSSDYARSEFALNWDLCAETLDAGNLHRPSG